MQQILVGLPPTLNMCSLKRDLYLLTKKYNEIKIMNYCKFICNKLAHTTKGTKRSYYITNINTPWNKIKMTWNVVKIYNQQEDSI